MLPELPLICTCSFITAFVSFVHLSQAYVITLDATAENECFHERVSTGTKLGFTFEVMDGGFYDVDVEIRDPLNAILHRDEKASEGKFTIEANADGVHQFCFSNKMSSHTPKVIAFDIDKTEPQKPRSQKDGQKKDGESEDTETESIASMLEGLISSSIAARHDVRYLTIRDRVHRKISERTNSTVVWWAGLEFILLLAVTLGQVWYLKRFFEIRRKA